MSPRKHVVRSRGASADSGGKHGQCSAPRATFCRAPPVLRLEVRDFESQRVALVRGRREFAEAVTPRTLPRTHTSTINPCNLWSKNRTQIMELPVNPPILPMLAKRVSE